MAGGHFNSRNMPVIDADLRRVARRLRLPLSSSQLSLTDVRKRISFRMAVMERTGADVGWTIRVVTFGTLRAWVIFYPPQAESWGHAVIRRPSRRNFFYAYSTSDWAMLHTLSGGRRNAKFRFIGVPHRIYDDCGTLLAVVWQLETHPCIDLRFLATGGKPTT